MPIQHLCQNGSITWTIINWATMKKENLAIYYMRFFAIILIVNSHFREKNIIGYEPVLFYDRFGFLGNMIFFFISSYVLTLGFIKYEQQKLKWTLYRLFYLCFIIISLRTIFGLINGDIPNLIAMLELYKISFISMMLLFSLFFPLLWLVSRNARLGLMMLLCSYCLFSFFVIGKKIPLVGVSEYFIVFLLGILLAKNEIRIKFDSPTTNIICMA